MTTVGAVNFKMGIDTSALNGAVGRAGSQIQSQLGKSFDRATSSARGFNAEAGKMNKVGMLAITVGNAIAQALVGAFRKLSQYVGDAVSRLDTLNNFPRAMANLGIEAAKSSKAVSYMADKLIGLPTRLDTATQSVSRFTAVNKNVEASTEMFLALNNAVLAGGAPTELQATAIEQMSQAYAKGKPDMMEWRALLSAMPAQLDQVAQSMGVGSAEKLRESLVSGSISMNDFMLEMVKLNKQGLPGFQSFAEQAKNSTYGVGVSMANLKTAFVRGFEQIMSAIGQANIAGFFQWISGAISAAMSWVAGFTRTVMTAVAAIGKLFGFTVKLGDSGGADSAGASAGAAAAGFDAMAGAAEDAGAAAGGAGGAAKKAADQAKKALMGFDKINKLPVKSDSSGGGGGGGGGGGAGMADLSALGGDWGFDGADKLAQAIDSARTKAQELFETFKAGFARGLGEDFLSSFERTKEHIASLKDSLSTLFSDPQVAGAAGGWASHVAYALGRITGAATSVGATLVELMFGSLDLYIKNDLPTIKERIINIFGNMKTMALDTGALAQSFANIFEIFRSDSAKEIGSSIIGTISNALLGAAELLTAFVSDVFGAISKPFKEKSDEIKAGFQTILDTLAPVFTSLKEGYDGLIGHILAAYEEHVAPAIATISEAISSMIDGALAWWQANAEAIALIGDTTIKPAFEIVKAVVTDVFKVLGAVIEGFVKVVKGVYEFIAGVFTGDWKRAWEGISLIFKGVWTAIKGIAKTAWDRIVAIFSGVAKWFGDKFGAAWEAIKKAFSTIGSWFKAKWDFIVKVFTSVKTFFAEKFGAAWEAIKTKFSTIGSWFKAKWKSVTDIFGKVGTWFGDKFGAAWEAIKKKFSTVGTFFSGIWETIKGKFTKIGTSIGDAIGGAFKKAINAVISTAEGAINGAVNLINGAIGLINKIPGVSLGRVAKVSFPRLAQGGYVAANTPQLAVIGDNTREGEIVAPESKLKAMAAETAAAVLAAVGAGTGTQTIVVPVNLNGREIARVVLGDRELRNMRSGGNEFA